MWLRNQFTWNRFYPKMKAAINKDSTRCLGACGGRCVSKDELESHPTAMMKTAVLL
jgi:hypothetical protein